MCLFYGIVRRKGDCVYLNVEKSGVKWKEGEMRERECVYMCAE